MLEHKTCRVPDMSFVDVDILPGNSAVKQLTRNSGISNLYLSGLVLFLFAGD
jgi:hypothetical protein